MSETRWQNGIIRADSGDMIAYPRMPFQEFVGSPLGALAKEQPQRQPYREVVVTPVLISGYECCVDLKFQHDVLRRVLIELSEDTVKQLGFVGGYASPPDGAEVAFLEEWVRREVGRKPPVDFPWGRIGQVYDPIGGFARILFQYT